MRMQRHYILPRFSEWVHEPETATQRGCPVADWKLMERVTFFCVEVATEEHKHLATIHLNKLF